MPKAVVQASLAFCALRQYPVASISNRYIAKVTMIDVKMLCLSALMGREASGYDIKKELERGSSAGLIDASFGSIYPALARLADDGYIAARSEAGGRGRGDKKIYAITPEGRAYFLRTLSGPIPDEKYRSPFLFAMLFADCLPRERVRVMIDRQIQAWEDKLAAVDETAAALPPGAGLSFVHGFADVTLRAGLDHLRRHRAALEATALSETAQPVRPRTDAAQTQPAPAAE